MMTGERPTETITTLLEMREHLALQVTPPHRSGMLVRLIEPVPSFYRYLLRQAGLDAEVDDDDVVELITDDAYDVYILFVGGAPAGMFELDRREPAEIELRNIAVFPEFAPRRLDRYLVSLAVDAAWEHGPERLWVRATNRDDPRRILTLQWAGFAPYETVRE
jgi:GNAT superfamily N-acetyltransferase